MGSLVDHQVVQRGRPVALCSPDAEDVAVFDLAGTPVTDWVPSGTCVDLPAGGPYEAVARGGSVLVRDFLVGDLWVLAGQSNMQGIGRLADPIEPPSPLVHVLDLRRQWRLATEPLHRIFESPDLAHYVFEDPDELAAARETNLRDGLGAGLGVAFGKAMSDATGVPVGLIAAAQGGTSLNLWSPDRKDEGGHSLFGSMLLQIEAAGGRIAGMLWYQGESDAIELLHEDYGERLTRFVQAVRQEVGRPDLPFYQVQIGRVLAVQEITDAVRSAWLAVREVQRTIDLGPGGTTTAIDLGLTDVIHITTVGLRRLGCRLAKLAHGEAHTITLDDVEVHNLEGRFEVRLRFGGVTGVLCPEEHVAGFSIRTADGAEVPVVYEVDVDSSDPAGVVIRGVGACDPVWSLWYGHGVDPYCNLVDAADMAVPAFGPVPLPQPV